MFELSTVLCRAARQSAAVALLGSLWFTACHGESSSAVAVQPHTSPTAVSGHIWYMESFTKGSFIAPMDASSPPRRLTSDTDPEPWPDGGQYTEYTLGRDRKTDTLRVLSTRDGRVLHQIPLPHFSGSELRPSPISKTVVLTKYYAKASDDLGLLAVFDVASGRLIHSEPAQVRRQKFRWLPDGRLLRLDTKSGDVAMGSIKGDWQTVGRVAIPSGREVRRVEINPQGTQMALVMEVINGAKSDAWLARLDGSQLERVTADGATNLVYWSPDGQRLLFDYDDTSCLGRSCTGTCLLWYAPATARNLTRLYDAKTEHDVATPVQQRSASGSLGPLITCTAVHGWLP